MKKISNLALLVIILLGFTGCKERVTDSYYVNSPGLYEPGGI